MRACIHFEGFPTAYYFEHPKYILKAHELHEVQAIVEQAEVYAEDHYVVGYLTYEAAESYSKYMKFGHSDVYAAFYIFDTYQTEAFSVNEAGTLDFSFSETKSSILDKIVRIQDEIRHGNTYQVNYTTELTAHGNADAYTLYHELTRHNNGQYTAFIEDADFAVISISPELFFSWENETITTKPMKGTVPRSVDPMEDRKNYEWLKQSDKDKAENVMIVDLLRNDLSRIAKKNSVHVPGLFEVTPYHTVYQMTSTITAEVQETTKLNDIFKALYPCGSITGAPKLSTMNIINQLERRNRGVYCGAIGLMTRDKKVFNVPIRTIEKRGEVFHYGVGGGITINSNPEAEFYEMVAKTSILKTLSQLRYNELQEDFHLIETMYLDADGIRNGALHQQRLTRSAAHFGLRVNSDLLDKVFQMTSECPKMLRLTVYDSYMDFQISPLPEQTYSCACLMPLSQVPLELLNHKTSIRSHLISNDGMYALYYNDEQMVTEFNIGNLVYKKDGQYFTPATSQQLPGVMQTRLLTDGMITKRDIYLEEIDDVELWMVNALRGWVKISLIEDGHV